MSQNQKCLKTIYVSKPYMSQNHKCLKTMHISKLCMSQNQMCLKNMYISKLNMFQNNLCQISQLTAYCCQCCFHGRKFMTARWHQLSVSTGLTFLLSKIHNVGLKTELALIFKKVSTYFSPLYNHHAMIYRYVLTIYVFKKNLKLFVR